MLKLLSGYTQQAGCIPQSSASVWHPLFGWCKGNIDIRLFRIFGHVQKQLQVLWQPGFIDVAFSDVLGEGASAKWKESSKVKEPSFLIKSYVCEMYLQFLSIMETLRVDILIGLGCNEEAIFKMWSFFKDMTRLRLKEIVEIPLNHNILSLFTQTMLYMLIILDDYELFKKQTSFLSSDFAEIAVFLNNILFYVIWEDKELSIYSHCQALLTMLYNRDCKQHFCLQEHWLIKDVKMSTLIKELDCKTTRSLRILSQLPHVYPHRKRVEIFHQRIKEEKECLRASLQSHPTTYITIHRDNILEDGYQQLGLLSQSTLKGTIRVKFINTQGLDEAGIDESGVFKEFLEDTLKVAFNPDLNLFKSNVKGHLFPSSLSGLHENHLSLFEFIGRMLGKAVYEGIVVDIHCAPFFLSHLLHQSPTMCCNYLDELASFDEQLYSSLNFIKQYTGDVAELCLTFSLDEEFMGKTLTHELVAGGCGIQVTPSNRFTYVHRMALFKLSTQIKKQIDAFTKGFHYLINPAHIKCFSPQELQKLISGDQADIDVNDLRKYTEYLGGYHANHRVILWLWDILQKDFNTNERAQFLKFVTSCSRPPLLGFKHLHPSFTVRCVQVSHSEESGETVAGIIKGFFSRQQSKERLPSASTCFNILKLPNYSKKSILRDKLKYAILANCGFEMS
jgi:ubiquitin-protein ligase E3 B